jgi:uroporphyrinogen-III synthase
VTPLRLLITRPEPEAERTAAELRARGHEALLAPLLRYEPIADADLGQGPWAGVVMTSAAAARAIAQHPRLPDLLHLPVLTVGERSGEAARAAGFAVVDTVRGDGRDLARLATERFARNQRLLYLAAEDRAFDLAAALATAGITVVTTVVYRMVALREFPRNVEAALAAHQVDGVLHYSRRSAETYVSCADAAGMTAAALTPAHYCLSAEIAAVLTNAGANVVRHAPHPDESSLLKLIAIN